MSDLVIVFIPCPICGKNYEARGHIENTYPQNRFNFDEAPIEVIASLDNGETGPGARTTEYKWVEDLFWECKMASIPFFFKKVGDNPDPNLVGAAITEYRQWPNSQPGGLS